MLKSRILGGDQVGVLRKADGSIVTLHEPSEPEWSEDGRFVTIRHAYGTVRLSHIEYLGMDTEDAGARPADVEILDEGF